MSKLVFGTGGRFGRLKEVEAFELVRFAFVNGINTFDTGSDYSNGLSQSLLYNCLLKIGVSRNSFSICTKISVNDLLTLNKNELLLKLFSGCQSDISYLDTLMLWGPSLSDLHNIQALDVLRALQHDGIVRRIGVNTHNSIVMDSVIDSPSLGFVQDIMVDFNILQSRRSDQIHRFVRSHDSRRSWAGTALCQGFLLQSLLSMYLRTRSISYVVRALLNKPTRTYLIKCSPIRRMLRLSFGSNWREVPLSFVLGDDSVSYVPMGMLSKASISANVDVALSPVPDSLINAFISGLSDDLLADDVFT